MPNKTILIPLPAYGFDPTEVAIPWRLLSTAGFNIVFATPNGQPSQADKIMVTGKGLGIWRLILPARKDAVQALKDMQSSEAFVTPIAYADIQNHEYDALLLSGGHDKSMREYLKSTHVQTEVVRQFNAEKPVAAICHGVVVAARSIDTKTQKSVLFNYKTTALLEKQELLAFQLTRFWMKDYYLTYPGLTVEAEVTSTLRDPNNFLRGPTPSARDDLQNLTRGYCVQERHYISARWPGDVYSFTIKFINLINNNVVQNEEDNDK